jgi:hypothetical protein
VPRDATSDVPINCPASGPTPELCDGIDNDCDGKIDEDDPVGPGGKKTSLCDDGNPCTDDSCDAKSGCQNACTVNDACSGGSCVAGALNTCNDSNVCTDDVCNTTAGVCSNNANTQSCSDGNACTLNDQCSNKTCVNGAPKNCSDANGKSSQVLQLDTKTGQATPLAKVLAPLFGLAVKPALTAVPLACKPGAGKPDCNGNGIADACDVQGPLEKMLESDAGGAYTDAKPADVDGDGDPDIVTFKEPGAVWLENQGGGLFALPKPMKQADGAEFGVTPLHLADLNADGKADLVRIDAKVKELQVFSGKGDGTMTPAGKFATNDQPMNVLLGDWSGDGLPDLAVACQGKGTFTGPVGGGVMLWAGKTEVRLYVNDGTGAFEERKTASCSTPDSDRGPSRWRTTTATACKTPRSRSTASAAARG